VRDLRWIVFDYGGVLAHHQSTADWRVLAEMASVAVDDLSAAYWAERDLYDAGVVDAEQYWTRIGGRVGRVFEPDRIRKLVDMDVRSWLALNPATLTATASLAARGYRLAILSNAPRELAAALRDLPELASFHPKLFSAELKTTKPDQGAYRAVLAALEASADQVAFVDDRPVNVTAAELLGIHGVVFASFPAFVAGLLDKPSDGD
jgi:putative hydrolase of the HAD superfamily